MKALSLVLTATLIVPVSPTAATLPAPSPVLNGNGLYQLQHARGSAQTPGIRDTDEDFARRTAALELCAGSVAQPMSEAYGSSGRLRVEIVGSKYRNNGDLRIFGAASVRQPLRTVEFSCDIDMHGNLRRVDLGRLAI